LKRGGEKNDCGAHNNGNNNCVVACLGGGDDDGAVDNFNQRNDVDAAGGARTGQQENARAVCGALVNRGRRVHGGDVGGHRVAGNPLVLAHVGRDGRNDGGDNRRKYNWHNQTRKMVRVGAGNGGATPTHGKVNP